MSKNNLISLLWGALSFGIIITKLGSPPRGSVVVLLLMRLGTTSASFGGTARCRATIRVPPWTSMTGFVRRRRSRSWPWSGPTMVYVCAASVTAGVGMVVIVGSQILITPIMITPSSVVSPSLAVSSPLFTPVIWVDKRCAQAREVELEVVYPLLVCVSLLFNRDRHVEKPVSELTVKMRRQ